MAKSKILVVGDKIKLTADFLRSTGQTKGGEGQSRWTVVECKCGLCRLGGYVATDELSTPEPGELPRQRHFNAGNMQRVGERRADRVPQGGFLKLHKGL